MCARECLACTQTHKGSVILSLHRPPNSPLSLKQKSDHSSTALSSAELRSSSSALCMVRTEHTHLLTHTHLQTSHRGVPVCPCVLLHFFLFSSFFFSFGGLPVLAQTCVSVAFYGFIVRVRVLIPFRVFVGLLFVFLSVEENTDETLLEKRDLDRTTSSAQPRRNCSSFWPSRPPLIPVLKSRTRDLYRLFKSLCQSDCCSWWRHVTAALLLGPSFTAVIFFDDHF